MSQLFDTRPLDAPVAFAKVALEQGIDLSPDGLTYGVPLALSDLHVGERVSVPLGRGNKAVPGYVLAVSETCDLPEEKQHLVKSIVSRDESGVTLTADLVELAKWMASYYCCPLGMVFVTMLPAAVKHGTGSVTSVMVGIAEEKSSEFRVPSSELKDTESESKVADGSPPNSELGTRNSELPSAPSPANSEPGTRNPELPPSPKLTALQKTVLAAAISQREAGVAFTEIRELADLAGAKTVSPVQQLIAKGILITHTQAAVRAAPQVIDAYHDPKASGSAGLKLTTDQAVAIEALSTRVHEGFSVTLLHGVTGSGKTEVYLRAIEETRKGSELRVPGSELKGDGAKRTAEGASTVDSQSGTRNSELETPPRRR